MLLKLILRKINNSSNFNIFTTSGNNKL